MATDDTYTVALLHLDGLDESTTFTDESGKVWTPSADSQIDTAQSKFGGASGLFDGTDDYVSTPDHADFDFGTGDFTIDFWLRAASGVQTGYAGIITGRHKESPSSGWSVPFDSAGKRVSFTSATEGDLLQSTTDFSASVAWRHVAIVRYGNVLTLYINGTSEGTVVDATGKSFNCAGYGAVIGRLYVETGNWYYKGHIDEIRISKGIARWTGNFTPSTAAYPPSYDTNFKPTITTIR